MVWDDKGFTSMASLTDEVPIITIGGIGKRFLVPGWRMGWATIYDPVGVLDQVRHGLYKLTTMNLHPNSVLSAALPDILQNTPSSFFEGVMSQLNENAELTAKTLSQAVGCSVEKPSAAMYAMCKLDFTKFKDIRNAYEFVQLLVKEEAVLALPGECFEFTHDDSEQRTVGFLRIVISHPREVLLEAYDRMTKFCERHAAYKS